jgi:hypothetical protein
MPHAAPRCLRIVLQGARLPAITMGAARLVMASSF